jgi:hypothetical protein
LIARFSDSLQKFGEVEELFDMAVAKWGEW